MSEKFLSRWARLKTEQQEAEPVAPPDLIAPTTPIDAAPVTEPIELPAIDTLTPSSDFTAFLQAGVDQLRRGQALKKLFADPHFNAMDGLDVYIDDYNKADPLPIGWLEKLNQARGLIFPEENAHATEQQSVAAQPSIAEPLIEPVPAPGIQPPLDSLTDDSDPPNPLDSHS